MKELFQNPLTYVVIIAICTAIFKSGTWVGGVNEDRKSFKKFMEEVKEKLDKILERLPAVPFVGSSPLRLTDLGQKMSAQVGGKEWVARIVPDLINDVAGMPPYEIQEFCINYMTQTFRPTPAQLAKLQECAYESGLEVSNVLKVLAVELRDKLLELTEQND